MKLINLMTLLLSSLVFTNALSMEKNYRSDGDDSQEETVYNLECDVPDEEQSNHENIPVEQLPLFNFKTIYKNKRSLKELCLALIAKIADDNKPTNFLDACPIELKELIISTKQMMGYFELIKFHSWSEEESKLALQLWYANKSDPVTAMAALSEFDKMRSKEDAQQNCQILSLLLATQNELKDRVRKLQRIILDCAEINSIKTIKFLYAVYPQIFVGPLPTSDRIYSKVNPKNLVEALLTTNSNNLELIKHCLELIKQNELSINPVILLLSVASSRDAETCKMLLNFALELKINLNTVCVLGDKPSQCRTPLMLALGHKSNCSLKLLLENGADLLTRHPSEPIPLQGFLLLIKNLSRVRKQINISDKEDLTEYINRAKEFYQLLATLTNYSQPKLDTNTTEFNELIEIFKKLQFKLAKHIARLEQQLENLKRD